MLKHDHLKPYDFEKIMQAKKWCFGSDEDDGASGSDRANPTSNPSANSSVYDELLGRPPIIPSVNLTGQSIIDGDDDFRQLSNELSSSLSNRPPRSKDSFEQLQIDLINNAAQPSTGGLPMITINQASRDPRSIIDASIANKLRLDDLDFEDRDATTVLKAIQPNFLSRLPVVGDFFYRGQIDNFKNIASLPDFNYNNETGVGTASAGQGTLRLSPSGVITYSGRKDPNYSSDLPFANLINPPERRERDKRVEPETNPMTAKPRCPEGYAFDEVLQVCMPIEQASEPMVIDDGIYNRLTSLDTAPANVPTGFDFNTANQNFLQSFGARPSFYQNNPMDLTGYSLLK
jgi:hypothetical protein